MDTRIFNLTWIYDVILVVVLGGIGLSGGRGGVMNVIVGTMLIGTIVNGMTILNVSFEGQNLVRGLVLLSALLIDSVLNPRKRRNRKTRRYLSGSKSTTDINKGGSYDTIQENHNGNSGDHVDGHGKRGNRAAKHQ